MERLTDEQTYTAPAICPGCGFTFSTASGAYLSGIVPAHICSPTTVGAKEASIPAEQRDTTGGATAIPHECTADAPTVTPRLTDEQIAEGRRLCACPFCGGEAAFGTVRYSESMVREQGWEQQVFHYVNCVRCGSCNRGIVGHATKEDAAAHWNKRPALEELEALRKREKGERRKEWDGASFCWSCDRIQDDDHGFCPGCGAKLLCDHGNGFSEYCGHCGRTTER